LGATPGRLCYAQNRKKFQLAVNRLNTAHRFVNRAQANAVTMPAGIETAPAPLEMRPTRRVAVNLFWRTFFLLSALLLGCILAWLQTFRALEFEPRALQNAQQLASLVNLSRAGLLYSDAIQRVSLVKALAEQEGVRITPREPADRFELYAKDAQSQRVATELANRLGSDTIVANKVNGESGLWVGFSIEKDKYWLLTDPSRLGPVRGKTWLIWLTTAALLSLAGAALIARLINRPLKQLSFAASRVRDGDFDASKLDERVATSEIREVNIGFNRMAQQLAKIEQDRAIMLAGISHDLRTPLARLRLETELSVIDREAQAHMVADIDQLDAIIDKFLDYARPDQSKLEPVLLNDVVEAAAYIFKDSEDMRIKLDLAGDLFVLADEVELARVVSNLLENARRYGKSPDSGICNVEVTARAREDWVMLKVRDHGIGVAPDMLDKLTKPFFRGDAARTAATGAGLGLAIVDKTVQRMGGIFALANGSTSGLSAHIRLRRATRA
jgi:two-component system, OmpR family, osmolarity sensor histidine kinase EnvZ